MVRLLTRVKGRPQRIIRRAGMIFVPIGDINPRERIPYVNYALIGINIAVYFLLNFRPDFQEIASTWALVPSRWEVRTMFSSMFMHADLFHLGGNMLFLWIAGDNVEDRCGHFRYLAFYLLAGLAAGVAHLVSVQMFTPASAGVPTLGASGAVSGVLGAYVLLFPRARIRFFYWIFFVAGFAYLRSWFAIGGWFLLQLLNMYMDARADRGVGGVAYAAHVGGFAFGFAAMFLMRLLGLLQKPSRRMREEQLDLWDDEG